MNNNNQNAANNDQASDRNLGFWERTGVVAQASGSADETSAQTVAPADDKPGFWELLGLCSKS